MMSIMKSTTDRTASTAGQPALQEQPELSLRALLQEVMQKGASDLHITVGEVPKLRVDGDLVDSNILVRCYCRLGWRCRVPRWNRGSVGSAR